MNIQLDDAIASPQDLKAVILEIRQYAGWFAHASVKKQLAVDSISESPAIFAGCSAFIKDCFGEKTLSAKSLDEFVQSLEMFEKSAPTLTITLAAAPSNGLKKTFGAWCRQNVALSTCNVPV